MIEIVVPLLVILIAIIGVKKRQYQDCYLSIEQGNSAKGVAALLLVIVHIRERLNPIPIAYTVLVSIGFCLVAIFFFYSGYGIVKQALKNKNYIQKRLPKRIIYLIELIVFSELVYYIVNVLFLNRKVDFWDFLKCITGFTMLNGAMWTIIAMIVIQLVVCLLYPFSEKWKNRYTTLTVIGVLFYVVFSVLRGRGAWEMQSCLAFSLGAFVAEHDKEFENIIYLSVVFVFSILVFVFSLCSPYVFRVILGCDYDLVRIVSGSVCSCAFILCMLYIFKHFRIINPATKYVGALFTEIYLFHGIVLDIVKAIKPEYFHTDNAVFLSIFLIMLVCIISIAIKKLGSIVNVYR